MVLITVISVMFILFLTQMSVSQHKYVSYIDFPTCGEAIDAHCLSTLGVPDYSTHNYNVLNFAFYISKEDKFYDAAFVWSTPSAFFSRSFRDQIANKTNVSDSEFRQAIKELYATKHIKILLSVFGATDDPILAGLDAITLANKIANLILTYNYDGVDINFWNRQYLESDDGQAKEFLITLTKQIRDKLGWNYIITHAPIASFFMDTGSYLKIHEQVGELIDWYNILYYNEGNAWVTYDSLFIHSTNSVVNTAVNELICGTNIFGITIPENKIVIGKYIRQGLDGLGGWISANNLKQYFLIYGWFNGFVTWQFPGDIEQNFSFSNTIMEAFNITNHSRNCPSEYETTTVFTTNSTINIMEHQVNSNKNVIYFVIACLLLGSLLVICIVIFLILQYNKRNKQEQYFISNPLCVIIPIGKYDIFDDLPVEKDIENLRKLFKFLKYKMMPENPETKLYWTENELIEFIKNDICNELFDDEKRLQYDGLIVCMSCHGIYDKIVSSDRSTIEKNVIHRIISIEYPEVRDIPRIFIFDSCAGNAQREYIRSQSINIMKYKQDETKAVRLEHITTETDWTQNNKNPDYNLVQINAANPGYMALCNSKIGSYLTHSFAQKVMKNINEKENKTLETIFREIQNELHDAGKEQTENQFNNNTGCLQIKINDKIKTIDDTVSKGAYSKVNQNIERL